MKYENEQIGEKALLKRIKSGNKEAFETLYRNYYARLCNFLYRFVDTRAICEELVQDIFLHIWMNRQTWEPKGTISSYLYKSAKNRALDYLKHLEVENRYLESQNIETGKEDYLWDMASSGVMLEETKAREEMLEMKVEAAIKKLPPKTRIIFKLSREDGLTYREIAQFLDLSDKTIETQMGRALYKLRSYLSHLLIFPPIIGTALWLLI